MIDKKLTTRTFKTLATTLFSVVLTLFAGCNKEESKAEAKKDLSPEAYMNDPVFLGKLKAIEKEGNQLRGEIFKLKEKIEALRKVDPNGEELKKLEVLVKAKLEAFENTMKQSRATVRERLRPEKTSKSGK